MNLATLADAHPRAKTALVDAGGPLSYGELDAGVSLWRRALGAAGVGPDDRVVMACANDRHFVFAYLATLHLGGVAVPLNPSSPVPEIARQLETADARVGVGAGVGARVLAQVDRGAVGLVTLVVPDGTRSGEIASPVVTTEELAGSGASPGALSAPAVERAGSDPAVLLFTSGTAGSPKAAVLTHGSLRANLEQIQSHPGRKAIPEDVGLGILPLFHVFGLNVVLNLSLATGGTLVLADRPDAEASLAAISSNAVTLVAGAPVLYGLWAAAGNACREAMATVRMAISGASPLSPDVADAFEQAAGIPLWEGYGLTEASPVVSSGLMDGIPRRGSVGVPLPGVEVRLVGTDGHDVLTGDPGEVWVRGPNVFPGYWRDPEATARVLTGEGWLRTGDAALASEDGHLFLVDRLKDLIIVSGFNVYPQEVERAIETLDDVVEVAVAGKARIGGGESVVAWVVAKPGSDLSEADVVAAVSSQLAGYKVPGEVRFVRALPHGLSGEVLRRALAG